MTRIRVARSDAVLRACIAAGRAYVDVCDDASTAMACKALHKEAKAKGVPCVTTAGIYPGVSNIMAAEMLASARVGSDGTPVDTARAKVSGWAEVDACGADGEVRAGEMGGGSGRDSEGHAGWQRGRHAVSGTCTVAVSNALSVSPRSVSCSPTSRQARAAQGPPSSTRVCSWRGKT